MRRVPASSSVLLDQNGGSATSTTISPSPSMLRLPTESRAQMLAPSSEGYVTIELGQLPRSRSYAQIDRPNRYAMTGQ